MRCTINPALSPSDREYAEYMVQQLTARAPFADVYELSDWLHRTHPNPRVRYTTANDRQLRIEEGKAILITITLI